MKITCNPKEAADAMEQRYYRFEVLSCHIEQGIQAGIKAHNIHEQGHRVPPMTPEEISMSLMNAVASHFRHDAVAVERFIELLRLYVNQENLDDYLDFMESIDDQLRPAGLRRCDCLCSSCPPMRPDDDPR